jgi:spore maturation protein CgeB
MRWLVAGPDRRDTFAHNIAATLVAMGHDVLALPSTRWRGRVGRVEARYADFRQKLSRSYVSPGELQFLKATKEWRPQVFLAPTQEVGEETLRGMKRLGVGVRVAWWGDAPANMRRMGLASREWDLLLFKDGDAARKFRCAGLNAHQLHEAMNPMWHRPLAEQKNGEVVVAGNWYGFRQFLVMELLARGVKIGIYGSRPPRWAPELIRRTHTNRYIVCEEKSRVFGEGLACLNSMAPAEGNSLNCRAFEIAGAGGLQIIEDRPAIEECFAPNHEVLVFRSIDELMEHIERGARYPTEMRGIRGAGARRAVAQHTYRHRMERILDLIGHC